LRIALFIMHGPCCAAAHPNLRLPYIKRLNRQILLRFTMAELRISASTNELCDRLIEAFRDLKVQRVSHSETLQVSVAFAVVEQAFEEF
jgi:hypothetical protein